MYNVERALSGECCCHEPHPGPSWHVNYILKGDKTVSPVQAAVRVSFFMARPGQLLCRR